MSGTPDPDELGVGDGLERCGLNEGPDPILQALSRDGAVIVEGLIDHEAADAIRNELAVANEDADPLMRNVFDFDLGFDMQFEGVGVVEDDRPLAKALGDDETFTTGNTRNVSGLAARSPTFVDAILLHPMYAAVCDYWLKPHSADYVLNHGHLINVGPGAKGQPLHRDSANWCSCPGLGPTTNLQLASVVALTDFTAANGATRVVPGSHLWEGDALGQEGRLPEPSEEVQAVMPKGSAVIYTGWTYHGAGRNTTADAWRWGIHVSFCQGWLRTDENNTLATPPDVARHLPRRAQELLGYGVHSGLGMVNHRTPIDQMREGML